MTRSTLTRLAGAALLLTVLGGCLSQTLYYRSGASIDRARADEVECGRIALAQAPVAREREVIHDALLPGPVICEVIDGERQCYREPPWAAPPRVVVRDVNKELRALIARQCMADRGYDRVTLPACSDQVAASVTPAITRVMPRLTPQSCVIRQGGEKYQIVPG